MKALLASLATAAVLVGGAAASDVICRVWGVPEGAEPYWVTDLEANALTAMNCSNGGVATGGRGESRQGEQIGSLGAYYPTFQHYVCRTWGSGPYKTFRASFFKTDARVYVSLVRSKLARRKARSTHVVCKVIAGQPVPEICR